MSKHFTNLHLHTEYSLLDGAIAIDKLIKFGKQNNFKALCMTDHGNIFGAVRFFAQAKKAQIKPILGIEAYFTQDVKLKDAENKYYHLILLVENAIGYKNLCKLISYSYQEGFYFKPRIDYRILEKHSEGLIATSACLGGHIPSLLMQNNEQEAEKKIDWFLDVFGPERFYLEVQPEDQKEQIILNQKIFEISKKKNIECVATGDCHYILPDDREAHEVMLSIQTHHKITDANRFTFGDCRVHIRTEQEMLNIFSQHESAVWNSGKIADMCNFDFETGKLFFPQFEIPQQITQEEFFKNLCQEGFKKLIEKGSIDSDKIEIYQKRLDLEVSLISKMGFIGYFLVVSDFIKWAKINNIPVGPGRGSAAGSIVAWSLEITDIDPIKYNLLFERFLNPERISMPDIDIDFCIEGRDKVINYVKDKYGHDKVCQIITFGTMMAKGVIKDVARALGFPFEDSNAITELIPDQLKITLEEAIEQEPRLKKLIESNSKVAHIFNLALRLEGLTRHASKHAAGIVISPEPISDVLPVYIPPKSTDLVTQYAMTELESLGFLKMDFLGLKNLTLIKNTLDLIKRNHNIEIDISKIPIDDKKAYDLMSAGKTSGVFQLESDGIKDVLIRLQPEVFEDVIAVNALYRPGPLGSGMVDDFIERKHGRQKIVYLFDELESILKETYGVIVYQEQVMKIASTIAGYSLGESDILRRAMGKKKADVMEEQRAIFTTKAIENNFDGKKAGELFDLMAYFAGYGFNKSHSAAYALIAYQTAYLKANYCAEFMACLISLESSDAEKMSFYLQEAKELGIDILPPDINYSEKDFTVINNQLRFGLSGIKNVGTAAISNIQETLYEKTSDKKLFKDLFDFCKRVDLRVCNKKVIESLICSGALDSLPGNRAQKFEELNKIIDLALEKKKEELTGQMGLFDIFAKAKSKDEFAATTYNFQLKEEWPDNIKLEKEKELLGIYISAQPLDSYKKEIKWTKVSNLSDLHNINDEKLITCCGIVKSNRTITTKKGDPMAFILIEDYTSKAEIVVFPKLFNKVEPWLKNYNIFIVKGIIDPTSNKLIKIKAQSIVPIDLIFEESISNKLTLNLKDNTNEKSIIKIKESIIFGSSTLEIKFKENEQLVKIEAKDKIKISKELLEIIEQENIETQIDIV